MRRRLETAALLAAALGGTALAAAGCRPRSEEPLTFRIQLASAPETLDPAQAGSTYAQGIIDRLFDGPMRLDRLSYRPLPALARTVEVSEDGRAYEIRLRDDIRFHNGRPIRASDVVYSWHRVLDPEQRSLNAWLLEPVAGAEAYRAGTASSIVGLEAEDPHLLRVRLDQPFAPFLYHLTSPALSVVPREAVESLGAGFSRAPVGSGPFRFVEWMHGERLVLEAADTSREKPAVERLVYEVVPHWEDAYRLFRAGQLDLLTRIDAASLPELRRTAAKSLRTLPSMAWQGFCFRCDRPPFDDERLRRAFSLAVDRDALVQELGEGRFTAAASLVPASVTGAADVDVSGSHDLERARGLLAAAGHPQGRGLPPVVLSATPASSHRATAAFVVEALRALGVAASYRLVDLDSLLQSQAEGRWSLHFGGWLGDYPDPEAYLYPLFHSQGSTNYFAYRNPEVDHLLEAARRELDVDVRRELHRRAERIVREEAPCVVLAHEMELTLIAERWTGIPLGYANELLEVERAHLREAGQ